MVLCIRAPLRISLLNGHSTTATMETRKGMIIAALALSAAVMGQGFGSIEGKLLDDNGDPVPFVSVTAGQGGNSWSATSDIELQRVEQHRHTVRVAGFLPVQALPVADLEASGSIGLDFRIQLSRIHLSRRHRPRSRR